MNYVSMRLYFFLTPSQSTNKHFSVRTNPNMHQVYVKGLLPLGEEIMVEQLFTAEEIAERLAVSPRTVIEWSRKGIIPVIRPSERIRRFAMEDVLSALKNRSGVDA